MTGITAPSKRRRRREPPGVGELRGENRVLRDLAPGWSVALDPSARPVRVVAVEWVAFDTLLWRFDRPVAEVVGNVAPGLEVVLNGGAWGGPVYAAVYDAPPEAVGAVIAVYDPLSWETGLSPQWRIEAACPELLLADGGGTIVVPQTGWVPPAPPTSSSHTPAAPASTALIAATAAARSALTAANKTSPARAKRRAA